MEVASARLMRLKEKGHFEHTNENERIDKYTLSDQLPARLASLQLHSMRPAYSIRKVHDSDSDAILAFLQRFFFRDEPMNQAINLLPTPESRCLDLEDYATSSLEDNVSVATFDDNGDMVGVLINGIARRDPSPNSDKPAECADAKFARVLKVLEHLEQEARIWEKLPADVDTAIEIRIASTHPDWRGRGLMRALCEETDLGPLCAIEIRIASTHPDWRGRGLMRALCEETEKIAKQVGAKALRMDATSAFSAAAAERLGYSKVFGVQYKDLPYAPQPGPPHVEARVYLKNL